MLCTIRGASPAHRDVTPFDTIRESALRRASRLDITHANARLLATAGVAVLRVASRTIVMAAVTIGTEHPLRWRQSNLRRGNLPVLEPAARRAAGSRLGAVDG